MKAQNGVYTKFLIKCEEDILELERYIKYYKPISPSDAIFLRKKIIKEHRGHLLKAFDKLIEKFIPSCKQTKDSTVPKKCAIEIDFERSKTQTHKAADFKFLHKEIKIGQYTLKTERAFYISPLLLQKISGDYEIRILPGKKFYFENYGLTALLENVEEYCFTYMDEMCKSWFADKIDSAYRRAKGKFELSIKDFDYNENSGKYELRNDAIDFCFIEPESLRNDFINFMNKIQNIPKRYKDAYIYEYPYIKHVNLFNKEFRKSLTEVVKKYICYTEEDIEVDNWYLSKSSNLNFWVYLKCIDSVSASTTDACEWIDVPSFMYHQMIDLNFYHVSKGKLYEFSDETIAMIEESVEQLNGDDLFTILKLNLQSIKTKREVRYKTNNFFWGYYHRFEHMDGTDYIFKMDDPLFEMSDRHYLSGHPRIEDFTRVLQDEHINRMAYFRDPNYMCSQDYPSSNYVDCYLLANDKYIALCALDHSKSTYIFKVKKGYIDMAIFLIWSYFSSRLYNKRDGKNISIERLFPLFGIEWYDNTGSPISKDKQGKYEFILPVYFFN